MRSLPRGRLGAPRRRADRHVGCPRSTTISRPAPIVPDGSKRPPGSPGRHGSQCGRARPGRSHPRRRRAAGPASTARRVRCEPHCSRRDRRRSARGRPAVGVRRQHRHGDVDACRPRDGRVEPGARRRVRGNRVHGPRRAAGVLPLLAVFVGVLACSASAIWQTARSPLAGWPPTAGRSSGSALIFAARPGRAGAAPERGAGRGRSRRRP